MKNVYDIKKEKNLNIILPKHHEMVGFDKTLFKKKVIVIIHLHYIDTIDLYLEYIKKIPAYIDVVVTVSDKLIEKKIKTSGLEHCEIIYKENRGRDISSFLVACREKILQYQYVCFVHDKKEKKDIYIKDTEAWVKCLWDNTLGSDSFINNILMYFNENASVGLLVPPVIISDRFKWGYSNVWGKNYDIAVELAKKFNLKCNLDITKSPITIGTAFWAKVHALKKLFEYEWQYEDFVDEPLPADGTISHAIERLLSYIAQDAGYETGWIMNSEYAGNRIDYDENVISLAFCSILNNFGIERICELKEYDQITKNIQSFCTSKEKIYIYGAGVEGKRCKNLLLAIGISNVSFLVSRKEDNVDTIDGLTVNELKNVELDDKCGIIIAISRVDSSEIIEYIKQHNAKFNNILLFKQPY